MLNLKKQSLKEEILDTQLLNVTGHSLGGHLASAFTLLFPSISTTTTFDSASLIDAFIETKNTLLAPIELESHDMDWLVDSLAVINLLYTLDNSFTLAKANELPPLASSDEYTELEGMMSYLARLFYLIPIPITM
ncbi:MAG: hypothetical protein GY787_33820 [Alteromonadales bacterium]|nr:hypothetical protein [Alteromonadales bacterium]